jgi:hypothetical protein
MKFGRFLPYLLLICLLAVQQGSYIHALSHWQDDVQANAGELHVGGEDTHHNGSHICKTCIAFAAVAAGMHVSGFALAAPMRFITLAVSVLSDRYMKVRREYGSRAPPGFLA